MFHPMEEGQVWQTDTASGTRSHILMTINPYLLTEIEFTHLIIHLLCDRPITRSGNRADIRFIKMTIDGRFRSSVYSLSSVCWSYPN
jgi:hypothetical protein